MGEVVLGCVVHGVVPEIPEAFVRVGEAVPEVRDVAAIRDAEVEVRDAAAVGVPETRRDIPGADIAEK